MREIQCYYQLEYIYTFSDFFKFIYVVIVKGIVKNISKIYVRSSMLHAGRDRVSAVETASVI